MRWSDLPTLHLFLLLAAATLAGCSPKPVVLESPKQTRNPIYIATAYSDAEAQLGRPPKDLDEIMPHVKSMGDPDDILVSPNDGLPYAIVWNVKGGRYPIAYEQKGKDGKRWVVDARMLPWEVTDEQFARLRFPPGHKPPSSP